MHLPKPIVYEALSTIPNVRVLQSSQQTIVEVPAITFSVSENNETVDLQNQTVSQNVEVTVDIWAKTSSEADSLLSQVHTKMKGLGYRLSFCMDIPDPENICRLKTRFDSIQTN